MDEQKQVSPDSIPMEKREFSLKRLIMEEDAQAMAELVVLLPLYLVLFVSMIYLGHLLIIRQQVVEASRWYAWATPSSLRLSVNNTFFPRFVKGRMNALGSGSVSVQRSAGISEIRDAIKVENGSQEAKTLAVEFLSNSRSNGTNIEKRTAKVSFRYNFPWFGDRFGRANLSVPNSHTVYGLQRIDGRREFTKGNNFPIMRYTSRNVGGLQAYSIYDDPFQRVLEYRGGFRDDGGTGHENHSCFWNREGLLGRDKGSPLFYYPY
jgi:hypothetical protein